MTAVDTPGSGQNPMSSSVSMEFEDDYDPSQLADSVGLAFGDKSMKATKGVSFHLSGVTSTFEDRYEPEVDMCDKLADAFGDGYRITKDSRLAVTDFENNFANPVPGTPEKSEKQLPASAAPPRPQALPSTSRGKTTPKMSVGSKDIASTTVKPACATAMYGVPVDDLLGMQSQQTVLPALIALENDPVRIGCESSMNAKFVVTNEAGCEKTADAASKVLLSSGPSSGSVLGHQQPIAAVQINLIEASIEDACSDDVVHLQHASKQSSPDDNAPSDVYPSTTAAWDYGSSFELVESNSRAPHSADEDDFDMLLHRHAANHLTDDSQQLQQIPSDTGMWVIAAAVSDENAFEFKANFDCCQASSASTPTDVAFSGASAFDVLIKSSGAEQRNKQCNLNLDNVTADTEDPFFPAPCRTNMKDSVTSPVTGDESSVNRAFKFSRTFSETVNEEDEVDPKLLGLDSGMVAIKQEPFPATPSLLHLVIDMTKPSPAITRCTSDAKKPANNLNIKPQAARSSSTVVGQVVTKAIPRPKPQHLPLATSSPSSMPRQVHANTSRKSGIAVSTATVSKKIATQGEADLLGLREQQQVVTLNFEIDSPDSSVAPAPFSSDGVIVIPLLLPPPPPQLSAALLTASARQNPFDSENVSTGSDNDEADLSMFSATHHNDSGNTTVEDSCVVQTEPTVYLSAKVEDDDHNEALLPLEVFRPRFTGHGWTLLLRKPPKKSLTKKRFWEEVYMRLLIDIKDGAGGTAVTKLALYRNERAALKGETPLQELKLCPGHQLSPVGGMLSLQQHDQYGKCLSVKLQHVHYRERPGLRADRVAEALPAFLKGYVRRPSAPGKTVLLEHAPQTTELVKLGALDATTMRTFVGELEDALMGLASAERVGVNIMYEKEEIIADAWDEYEALVDSKGHVVKQKARVRLFILCFVSGMPIIEVGINDRRRRGKEIVGRHDIVPVRAENWVNVRDVELHKLVKVKDYEATAAIRFQPLDACKFELMRFRYRPKANYELPLQLDAKMAVDQEKRLVEIRADVMVPGYYSNSKRKGQVPCEDIQITFPIPEEWIYKFRVEKHFKYGSLHATARRPGKIKGVERLTSAMGSVVSQYLMASFIECSVGDAKYEHVHHSVVWRIPCLPQRNQGAYKTHYFALRLELGAHDVIPDAFELNSAVEFTMPHTTVSGTAIRSISNCTSSDPPEKWVHHHAKFCYTVEISFEREIKELLPSDSSQTGLEPSSDQDVNVEESATAVGDVVSSDEEASKYSDNSSDDGLSPHGESLSVVSQQPDCTTVGQLVDLSADPRGPGPSYTRSGSGSEAAVNSSLGKPSDNGIMQLLDL